MSSTSTQSIPPGKIVLTYDNYCELPNDRNRYEILDGELAVTPAPAQNIKAFLATFIGFLPTILWPTSLAKFMRPLRT